MYKSTIVLPCNRAHDGERMSLTRRKKTSLGSIASIQGIHTTMELMGTKIIWIRLFYRLKMVIACKVNYISSKEL